ncbi:MAG: hypothetical protein ACYTGG_04715 [Planctomycetota bacterium]|jgi:hypothetical protein
MMLRFSLVRSPRLVVLTLLVLACGLIPVSPAAGQGTSGEIPDPISIRDLDRYARRLDLSDQQRQAIDVLHSDYQLSFRGLRDGPIEEYLQEHGGSGGFRMFMGADQDAVRAAVQDLESVLGRIRTLDNQFFDQVQAVLADEQIERLATVRRARERARYQRGMSRLAGFLNPGARVDLGAIVDELDLAPDVQAAVRPILETYERRLTTLAAKLHDDANHLPLEVSDRMEQAGVSVDGMRDRRQRETLFSIWQETQQELATQAAKLSDLTRRTYRQVDPLLPDRAAARLRREYLSRAYDEAPADRGPAARLILEALALDSITDEQREVIRGHRQSYRSRIDLVVGEMLDAIDARREISRMFRFDASESPEEEKYRATMETQRERFDEINASTIATVQALLGEEAAARIASKSADEPEDTDETGVVTAMVMVAGDGGGAVTTFSAGTLDLTLDGSMLEPSDPYIPDAITRRELRSYGRRLGVPPEMEDVLDALFDDYRARFDELRAGEIKAVHEFEQSMWSVAEDEDESGRQQLRSPTAEEVKRLYELRRKAIAAVNALDAEFFEDLQVALLDDEQLPRMERVRLARNRTVYRRASSMAGSGAFVSIGGPGRSAGRRMMLGGMGGSEESNVDLSRLVEDLDLTTEELESSDPVLFSYEQTITDVFRAHYEASMRYQEAMDKLTAESSTTDGQGRRSVRMQGAGAHREIFETDGRAARDARRQLTNINRSTLENVRKNLSEDAAEELRRAYNREAHPGIYLDPRSAESNLAAALNLPDLSPKQRSELGEAAMTYRAEYDALCEQLVEATVARDASGDFFDRNRMQIVQEQRRALEKLRFERDELSDGMRVRLRAMLTPEQAARLGGLDDPGHDD